MKIEIAVEVRRSAMFFGWWGLVSMFGAMSAYGDDDEKFTIAVISDTQLHVMSDDLNAGFLAQTQWIKDNKVINNIKYATQLGDIVTFGGGPVTIGGLSATQGEQWGRAEQALAKLDEAGVPWGIVAGNHDYDGNPVDGNDPAATVSYRTRYGAVSSPRFGGEAWFGGASSNELNTWQTFSAGGRKFLSLHLELDIPDSAIAWAQRVIDAIPGMPTLINTHVYGGTRHGPPNNPYAPGPGRNSQLQVFDKLIKDNDQIFMVLAAHTGEEWNETKLNSSGSPVFQISQDFAPRSADRSTNPWSVGEPGWMRLLEFDPKNDVIRVKTYDALNDVFETDSNSRFDLAIDFSQRFGPIQIPEVNKGGP